MFQIRLKEMREFRGLSQQALADAMGESQSTVGGWESGRCFPRYSTLLRIADFFDASIDYLVGRSSVLEIRDSSKIDCGFNAREREIVHRYRALSNVEQMMICKLLDLPPL